METQVYAINKDGSVWHRVPEVKKIIYDGLTQKILFENGEIILSIVGEKLEVSSISYSNPERNYQNSHNLIKSYNPSAALYNARNSILQHLINKTFGERYSLLERDLRKFLPGKENVLGKKIRTSVPINSDLREVLIGGEKIVVNL
jgi:hypothetical protein